MIHNREKHRVSVADGQGGSPTIQLDPAATAIVEQARQLGLLEPAAADPDRGAVASNLATIVDRAFERGPNDGAAGELAAAAGTLLSKMAREVRDGSERTDAPVLSRLLAPAFDQVKAEYAAKFRAAAIRVPRPGENDFRPEIAGAVRLITKPSARARYDDVAARTGVPWFAIAAIHYREADLNFLGHLHNGDPLSAKTTDVPAGRPVGTWPPIGADGQVVNDPTTLWRLSAIDALKDLQGNAGDWTVERMCYAFEGFNGFGNRRHGVPSAYLWNWTQFYNDPPAPAGGFPRDNVFSPDYVSKQAGVVVIIRAVAQAIPGGIPFRFEPA